MSPNDQLKYEHFYGLIERHKALIERLCIHRSSGDSYRCAELRQECYIMIWKHEKQINSDLTPLRERLWVYWLCRSAFSRLDFLHRANQYVSIDESLANSIAIADDWQPADHAYDSSPLCERIDALSSVLNSHECQAFKLMAEGYTTDEMSKELGIKPKSVIQLRYRIISKLRKHYRHDNNKKE